VFRTRRGADGLELWLALLERGQSQLLLLLGFLGDRRAAAAVS
jgi:hypothetical protein